MATPHSYILLRDKSRGSSRGELLELNVDGSYKEHTHSVRITTLGPTRCDDDGDVAPLSEVECDLLDGIRFAADRYEVYSTPGKLEWGEALKVGDTVLARLRDGGQQHQYTTAIIRWCGTMKWGQYMFGVEIMVSSYVYIPSCIEIV